MYIYIYIIIYIYIETIVYTNFMPDFMPYPQGSGTHASFPIGRLASFFFGQISQPFGYGPHGAGLRGSGDSRTREFKERGAHGRAI